MKRLIKLLLLLIVVGGVAVYFGAGWILDRATRKAIPQAQEMLSRQGIELHELDFGSVGLQSYNQIAWKDIEALVSLTRNASGFEQERAEVRIDQISARLEGFSFESFELTSVGLRATVADELSSDFDWASSRFKEAAVNGLVTAPYVSFELSVSPDDPMTDLRRIYQELVRLVREGETALPGEIHAKVQTVFDGAAVGVRLEAVPSEAGTKLQVDREDLAREAKHFNRPLTDAEIDVVAENPMRAPKMLFIKKYAENTSSAAHDRDSTVPQDAYRHVLWSYLLTREYGPEFAEEVTDAHEVGSLSNTEADHTMDYNNNAIGRELAARGRSESEILGLVKTDPRVIRSVSEVTGRRAR